MATAAVRMLAAADPAAGEEYFLPARKLLQGNPRQTVWMDHTDPSGQFMAGIWHSERGWHVLCSSTERLFSPAPACWARAISPPDTGSATQARAWTRTCWPSCSSWPTRCCR